MSQENELAIDVKSLRKSFSNKIAVNHLSFQIPKGSITGFIGPNGAGKTTTLRILCTLLKPDAGSVKIFGHDVYREADKIRHQLGFMPDYFGLYEDMEVYEYLDFFAAAYHIPFSKRKSLVDDILNLLDLSAKRNALINELSRGMQQRLSLGRALVHDPKLLLLDEPASGLDPRARMELMELLKELQKMGKTIFISSHILAELKNLCDFVVIIENGKNLYSGTIEDAALKVEGESSKLKIVVANASNAVEALKELSSEIKIELQNERTILIEYSSAHIKSAAIIKFLVGKDYEVEEAVRHSANLEDVFMRLTKGGIS